MFARRDYWVSSYDDSGAKSWLDSAGIDLIRGNGRLAGERAVEVDGTTYRAARRRRPGHRHDGGGPRHPRPARRAAVDQHRGHRRLDRPRAAGRARRRRGGVRDGPGLRRARLVGDRDRAGRPAARPGRAVRRRGGPRTGSSATGATIRLGVTADSVSRPRPGGRGHRRPCPTARRSRPTRSCAPWAAPRAPRTWAWRPSGVKVDARGYVEVDDTMRGRRGRRGSWLYAVGDVNGRNLLTHMGKYQARVAGDVIAARAGGAATGRAGMTAWARRPRRARRSSSPTPRSRPSGSPRPRRASAASASGSSTCRHGLRRRRGPAGRGLQPGRRGSSSTRTAASSSGATFVGPGRRRARPRRHRRRRRRGAAGHAVARGAVLPDHERDLAPAAGGVRPVTSRPPEIDLWDAARAGRRRPGCGASTTRCAAGTSRSPRGRPVFDPHCDRAGFRLSVARCDHEIVGLRLRVRRRARAGRGPTGSAAALPAEVATTWVGGHFELAGLAVLESHRRHGGGRRAARRPDGRRDPTGPAGHRRRRHGGRAAVGLARLAAAGVSDGVRGGRPAAARVARSSTQDARRSG